ncbi:putative PIF1 helicase-like protein [Trypanosoma rangeli]|uniref:ATP-dependent DNA helicase n=1 Tax=Trypanosoma rangeli TaxID=5698 RepID=A0A3R7LZC1_TRYRA|nr:putative PIF1 helicase-like protein [Trypanosoma rangeli]RNF06228.1 putative PIF1 helicase-like protein [Trypanosoma rangeli]|eukprot:RNF06228.1 putative PIF1 helicase-like protein [Trypanosoma rangeli]
MVFAATRVLLRRSIASLPELLQKRIRSEAHQVIISANTHGSQSGMAPCGGVFGVRSPSCLMHDKNQSSQLPYASQLFGKIPDFGKDDGSREDGQKTCAEEGKKTAEKCLSAEQRAVLQLALDGAPLFIGGDAGTGKSFLLRCIAEELEAKGLNVAVTASTGIAALGINGNTFHSTFGVPVTSDDDKETPVAEAASHIWYDPESLALLDVIIVDEVSLLHAGHIEALDLAARAAPGRSQHQPFGGIQVILSGDFLQLMHGRLWLRDKGDRIFCTGVEKKGAAPMGILQGPEQHTLLAEEACPREGSWHHIQREDGISSVKNRRLFLHQYCDCPAYESPVFQHCLLHLRLQEPVRQMDDPSYLEDLNKLRFGVLTHRLSRSALHNPEDPNAIRLFPVKRAVAAFNALKMLELNGEERYFKSELQVTTCSGSATPTRGCRTGGGRAYPDLLVIHFRNKPMSSAKWRRQAEELLRQLCSKCKQCGDVRIMIPPAPARYSPHLSVYVCFVGSKKRVAMASMDALRSVIGEKFLANSKDAAAARKHWGTILWETRKIDFLKRFLRFSLERRYAKVMQRDPVLQHKRLKVGCRVMLLRNLNQSYVNGSLGTVVSFQELRHVEHLLPMNLKVLLSPKQYSSLKSSKRHPNRIHIPTRAVQGTGSNDNAGTIVPVVRMDLDGKEVAIPWISLPLQSERREGICVVRITVMPLTPAYAYTVHKIQGLTFDHSVLFDGSGFFPCDHLIYVAASRVKRFSQFRMINVSPRMVSVNRGALRFMSGIPPVAEVAAKWTTWKRTHKVKEQRLLPEGAAKLSTPLPYFSLFSAEWRRRCSGRMKQKWRSLIKDVQTPRRMFGGEC